MKIVKPSFEILTNVDGQLMLQRIERAGRTCYKRESRITFDSAWAFVQRIIRSGHESVIEHESVSVRIVCDRGVSHEIGGHVLRQEPVAGGDRGAPIGAIGLVGQADSDGLGIFLAPAVLSIFFSLIKIYREKYV